MSEEEIAKIAFLGLFSLGVLIYGIVMGWFSLRNLRRGRLMMNAGPPGDLAGKADRVVAVCGMPVLHAGYDGPVEDPEVWSRHVSRVAKKVFNVRENFHPFDLELPNGGVVHVTSKPTEVLGGHSDDRGDLRWLSASERLTVMGRLTLPNEGATMVPDGKLGLLFSTYAPGNAGIVVFAKGALQFFSILAGIALCAIFALN